jgi:hypothetical protein
VDTSADALEPRLVVDRGGRGIVLWPSASGQIYVSRFDPQSRAWSARQAVDPVHADRTSDPSLDIDAQGRAIAAWHEIGESGSWEVMTNRFE